MPLAASPSVSATNPNTRTPIGQVTMLVYAWTPGQTEIQVQIPAEAQGTGPGPAAKRAEFASLILSELQTNRDILQG
jgi:hypothetical protein